jgi:hypothetical protein
LRSAFNQPVKVPKEVKNYQGSSKIDQGPTTIYDVDIVWDFGALGILPPFIKILKFVEAMKSEGLEG